jgi:biotin carboxylase
VNPPIPRIVLVESNTTGTGREFCRRAQALGLHPVVLAADPARYPYLDQDAVAHARVDTDDDAAVLAAVRGVSGQAPVVGVTSSSEYFVARAARAARHLGLPAPDPDRVQECRDKRRQRRLLADSPAGRAGPGFEEVVDPAQAAAAAARLGPRVVVKPVQGSGSVGVRCCDTPDEARDHAAELLARTTDERGRPTPGAVLVESFLTGPEFSIEVFDGVVVAVVEKEVGPLPYFVEMGHVVPPDPAALGGAGLDAVAGAALDAVAALGLQWGPVHVEVRLTSGGPAVVEVNPRLAGGLIPVLVRLVHGVDLVEAVVRRAAGMPPAVARAGTTTAAAIRFALADRRGVVSGVDGLTDAALGLGVVEVGALLPPGRPIRLDHSFQDRFAYAVATAPEAQAARLRATDAAGRMALRLVPSSDPSQESRSRT